jgi:hypothetical protein
LPGTGNGTVVVVVEVDVLVDVLVEVDVLVDVLVEVDDEDVVVVPGASGRTTVKYAWFAVGPGVLAETRTWQSRQSGKPLIDVISESLGDRQLNNDCGLSPLNTLSRRLRSFASNVATPCAFAIAGAFPEARSQ